MATNNQKCTNCEKRGLPILPVRYTVLPNNVKAALPDGISGARVTDIALDTHRYGLRTLREGWVYLFYEVGPRGKRYWETYKATPDGRLWKQQMPLPREPITHPACAQRAITVPMDLIAIERPEKCTGRVFIAFSEHAWHKEVFDRYASDEKLLQARMQFIKPSDWIGSGKDANGHAVVATQQAIDDVIEYMPGFDPRSVARPDGKQSFSEEKGNYKEAWLKQEVTRYPMHIRQASPASASGALVNMMTEIAAKDSGGGASNCPPMMLALWDGIGNVHELNGFRCDPVAWLDLYVTEERSLQIGALQGIDTAQAIVQSKATDEVKNREETVQQARTMTARAQHGSSSALAAQRSLALANAAPQRKAQINAYYDDMIWMISNNLPGSYRHKLVNHGQSTSAVNASSNVPYTGSYRDQILRDANSYLKAQPGFHDKSIKTALNQSWSKYEKKLRRLDIENFRARYKTLQSNVYNLQEIRSNDVGNWIQAPLFLDALEDYHSTDVADSISFEIVITDSIAGIGSTPTGQKILDSLITRWDPLQRESLIWRVLAMNQNEACKELGQLLKAALDKRETPIASENNRPGESAGANFVFSATAAAGKLNSHYGKLAKLALESDAKKISPLGARMKRLHVDTFGMTVGDAIFKKFRINQLGDFAGEKIIQTILLQRAGVSFTDTKELVKKQAEYGLASRREQIEHSRLRSPNGNPASARMPRSTQALYAVWEDMKSTEDGTKALRSSRIAVVAALMEGVNFYKLMTAISEPDTKLKIAQSGASLLSALITITMTPYYAVLKNSSRSQSWKLTGGGLSSFGTFISSWTDLNKALGANRKDHIDATIIYAVKGLAGAVGGGAILIDSMSTAAPLFKKIAIRHGTTAIVATAEIISKRIVTIAALRCVVMFTGWEITVGLLVLQLMADWLTPNELESWCTRCAFGIGKETVMRLTDRDVRRYVDSAEQENDFNDVMIGLS